MIVKIYSLHHPVTGELRYIGKTCETNIKERLRTHVKSCFINKQHSACWIRSIIQDGLYPEIRIVDTVPENEWEIWEKYYIAYYKTKGYRLTNLTIGGNVTPALRGRRLSKEHIEKIRIRSRRKHLDTSNYGIKRKIPIIQYSKEGMFIKEYLSALDAYRETGIWKESIRNCMRGKSKSAGGYVWKYKN